MEFCRQANQPTNQQTHQHIDTGEKITGHRIMSDRKELGTEISFQ